MLPTSDYFIEKEIQTHHFFGPQSKKLYQKFIRQATDYVTHFLDNPKFYSGELAQNLHKKEDIRLDDRPPQTLEATLEQLKASFLDHAVSYHHPDYVSHLNCPILLSAIAAELIATSLNTAIETWDQSTTATLIEQEVIRWICNHLNLPETSDGVFTSGGTQSNFMALLMARDHIAYDKFDHNIKENGWSGIISRFRIFCSEKAHFSIKKNAALLGMGFQAVISVETDSKMKMKPQALLAAIKREEAKGNIPLAVVSTLGTTDYGSFDPLEEISLITKQRQLWLHADGAYGGCYVLTETHQSLFKAIHEADSYTIDFHKTLYQPVSASAFLLKDRKYFRYVSHFADYLNHYDDRNGEQPDLVEKSIQTTRRFDALKVWMSLKVVGTQVIAASLEKVHRLAVETYELLEKDPLFEVAHKPELSTVVFRFISPDITTEQVHSTTNRYIRSTLFNLGEAAVATTRLREAVYLKFTLLNPDTTIGHLKTLLEKIKKTGLNYKINN